MKNLFCIFILLFSVTCQSQEFSQASTETVNKYNKFLIGQRVTIYMRIIKIGETPVATYPEDKAWKFDSKKDLKIIGFISEKSTTQGPNKFIRIKISEMFYKDIPVHKMIILLEEMSIGNEYLLNLEGLRVK